MAEMAEIIADEASAAKPEDAPPPAPKSAATKDVAPVEEASEKPAPDQPAPDQPEPEKPVAEKPEPEQTAPEKPVAEPEQKKPAAPEKGPAKPLTCTATLDDRYLIDGAEPLPHLDSPHALAYAVSDKKNPDGFLFALMCTPGMPIRVDAIRKFRGSDVQGTIPIQDWGHVFWEPAKCSVAVIIFEEPLGGKLSEILASGTSKIGEYDIAQRVIIPVANAILALIEAEIPHRAIRPDNLYFMDAEMTEVSLGECVTTPPGYDQPVMYESIARSMASPSGRGPGSHADDYYALGVTIVMILIGYNPMAKYSTLDILAAKIEKGSYAAVCGNARLPITAIEVLRGLLSDEVLARWGWEEVDAWANGRKQSPMQRETQKKASSPYSFDKQSHLSPRTLAYAFSMNHEEAFRTLKSDENFEAWLRRSLGDEEMADIFRALMDHAVSMAGTPAAEPDVVISRICMLLDPRGPIRYRGFAFMPDSLGAVIAVQSMLEKDDQLISDIIKGEIYEFWFKAQVDDSQRAKLWQRMFMRCRGLLKITDLGYGMERCLYEMNEDIPCQSKLIIDESVMDVDEILVALDKISNKAESDARPIDRHIAAFIGARFKEDIHLHLKAVSAPTPERNALGTLSLLAYLQYTHRTRAVLGLASWVGGLLGPVINTYHSRSTRRGLEKDIPQLVRKGSLPELFDLLENAERRSLDTGGFTEAQAEFVACEDEILEVLGVEGERDSKILRSGRKVTSVIAILLAMTIVTMLFIVKAL